jgi:plasmid stabilization system protein ParE
VTYWLHLEAEAELGDAAVYYALHASPVIAEAFLAEFERAMALLVENQSRGSQVGDDLRVFHFDRFPYTVVYEIDRAEGPRVFAIAHQHREPGYWRQRL